MTTEKKVLSVARVVGFAFGILLSHFVIRPLLFGPPAPQPISVRPMTETSIKDGYKDEQNRKKVQRAIATARQVYKRLGCRKDFSTETGRVSFEFGLSPRLLAGLVYVESSCNPNARDGRGSIGLTQVNSKVWNSKVGLSDPETNLRIGASILATYIHKYGLIEGLHHYNGYSDVHEHVYVNKVLTAAGLYASIPKG